MAVLQEKNRIMDARDLQRAITRISHEIAERNKGVEHLLLVGVHRRGVPLAKRIAQVLTRIEGKPVVAGALNVAAFRDDIDIKAADQISPPLLTQLPLDINDKIIILVDDVLFTGRTVRAALDALIKLGRPRLIQLAVLVDRGHRELPIRADYVGKNVPTSRGEQIAVRILEIDGEENVVILERKG